VRHFVSRGSMDIEGFGSKLATRFVDLGLIKDFADIYDLDWDKIAELEGFGEKSIQNLQQSIEASKKQPLSRLLNGLGIRHVGARNAQFLAQHFNSMDRLIEATYEDIEAIPGFGSVVAQAVYDFLREEKNVDLIERLRVHGLRMDEGTEFRPQSSGKLAGKTVVLTGRLESLTRSEAQDLLRQAGAKVTSSVSRNTDLVIAGDEPGSKVDRARELGVEIVDEAGFFEMLKEVPEIIEQLELDSDE
jgi:DNA ligase (NAD+)